LQFKSRRACCEDEEILVSVVDGFQDFAPAFICLRFVDQEINLFFNGFKALT